LPGLREQSIEAGLADEAILKQVRKANKMKQEIYEYEPGLADEAVLKRIRESVALKAAYGGKDTPLFDLDRVWKLLDGAIDAHIHSGPDACNTRLYDELELAVQACQVGMKAVVFKCHSTPSARSAYIVQKVVNQWAEEHNKKKIDVFGGIVLNYFVGGLNPEAVTATRRVGGKTVWLPTMDASFHRKVFGMPGGIDVIDENDHVVPALKEIFAMIAEGDMVLSICHQSAKEHFILIDEARKAGVKRIEICHPNDPMSKMTAEQVKIATEKGAYCGLFCGNFRPELWSWEESLEMIKVVGPDHIVAGSDCGHFMGHTPVEQMRLYITEMLVRGIPDKDVEKMVKTNATALYY